MDYVTQWVLLYLVRMSQVKHIREADKNALKTRQFSVVYALFDLKCLQIFAFGYFVVMQLKYVVFLMVSGLQKKTVTCDSS